MRKPFITKITIQDYKSIASCQVNLQPLMFLVGPNGSGKSNFLDAFRFVSESLRASLDLRGTRPRRDHRRARRRARLPHPQTNGHLSVRFDFELPSGYGGYYSFRIVRHGR